MLGARLPLTAACLTACLALPAEAQPRVYQDFNRGQFFTDAGRVNSYGFETAEGFGPAPGPISTLESGRVRFSTPTGGGGALATYGGTQALTASGDPSRPLLIEFTRPDVFAVAFDNLDLTVQPPPHRSPSEVAQIRVSFYGGLAPFEFFVNNTNGQFPVPVFFGLVSDAAVASVRISASSFVGATDATPHYIDNLSVGAAAVVPEPSTAVLLAAGLLPAAALAARRRRT